MAIIVSTENPKSLLNAIKRAVDEEEIETWSYDEDGDFTHSAEQWNQRAWLRPRIRENLLIFNIIPPVRKSISKSVYGIYHGRFIEMLLRHFDNRFEEASATALPTSADRVRPRGSEF